MNAVSPKAEKRLYEFDDFRVDPVRRRLMRGGELVPLTPKAFSILLVLLERPGEVVEKEDLIQKVWPDTFVTEANLTQNISSLRKALGERASESRYVVTVPGRGYSFVGDVFETSRDATGEIPVVLDPEALKKPEPAEGAPADTVLPVPQAGLSPARDLDPSGPIVAPVRTRRLQIVGLGLLGLALLGAGTLAILSFLAGKGEVTGGTPAPLGETAQAGTGTAAVRRSSVAVMGLRNLSGNRERAWLSTALAEMLTTELAAGTRVRVISGENVSQAQRSLSLPYADSARTRDLERLHSVLGADLIVVGSYLALGEKGGGKIRLDLRVQQLPDGVTVASVAQVGTEPELFELVSEAGKHLRTSLGWEQPSPEEARAVQALRPANPEATRLYAEGLARLRTFDFRTALETLEKAAEADPGSAIIRSAISQAWSGLGYDVRAAEEAEKAVRLAASLPKEERLAIEARYREAKKQWDEASEIYQSLWTFYPDNLEYGLRLAHTQTVGGFTKKSLETIAVLRRLPPPAGNDPRIDLAEALNAKRMSDFKNLRRTADLALEKGRRLGGSQVVAQALVYKGDSLLLTGHGAEARASFQEARELFSKEDDRTQAALMLTRMGVTLHEQSQLEEAEETFRTALSINESTGNVIGRALQLGNLGLIARDKGDLARAQELMEQSNALFIEAGDRVYEARSSTLLGTVLLLRGDIAGGRKLLEHALVMTRQSGTRIDEVRALDNLALGLGRQGRFGEARKLHEQALTIAESIGDNSRTANVRAGLADTLAHLGELRRARQQFDQALAAKRKIGDRVYAARILGSMARLTYQAGDVAGARKLSEESLRVAREAGARLVEAEALRDLGVWSYASNDLDGARDQLEDALGRMKNGGADLEAASCRLILASITMMEGAEPVEAERMAREVADWYGQREIYGFQARALALVAEALMRQGRLADARQTASRARELADRSEDLEVRVLTATSMARIEAAAGQTRAALGHLTWAIGESQRAGLVAANLSARLSYGSIQSKAGDPAGAQKTLAEVEQEAARRGFLLIASQVGMLRKTLVPKLG
ncbi:MAG TPA: tetratricopeptide repeat protein [Thermoanaerobaculia bacterium]|nr:tetratricopeptide repeat protein [Thermoanaerobaculia bacterium]